MSLNVYYLDDEADLCELFKELHESADVRVTTFTRPDDFVAAVLAQTPDLAFVDYRLPGTTGEKVCAKLPATLPKILVTGEVQISDDAGFYQVLRKPALFEEVHAVLTQFLDLKRAA